MCVYVRVCDMCVRVCVRTCVCTCVCTYVCVYVCVYVCGEIKIILYIQYCICTRMLHIYGAEMTIVVSFCQRNV